MVTANDILEYLKESHPESLIADGFDDAIIGITINENVVYDVEAMANILMKENDMDYDEAMEYLEYNTFSAYVGEYTPVYINKLK